MTLSAPAAGLRDRLAVALLALFAAGVSLAISTSVLGRIPHVTDGVSYAFQGKIFASGRLYLEPPPPPLPPLFAHENVVLDGGRWCALYPPGWPALLAVGWLAGVPWALAPLLLGLAVVGVWRLGRALFDPLTGLLAAAALAVSPFALLMSAGFLAHGPALCAAVWCLALLAEGVGKGNGGSERGWGRFLAAGLLGGAALLIRPFTAVALLAPAVVWALLARRRERRWLAAAGWMALGVLPAVAAFLLYDRAVFGGAFTTGYQAYDAARFGSVGAMSAAAGAALTRNLPWYLANLNRGLWGLPFPDLLILLPLLWPPFRGQGRGRDAMLAACAASLVVGYSFYYYRDVIYSGPRFAFEVLAPLSVLAGRSLATLGRGVARLAERLRDARSGRLARLVAVSAGTAVLLVFPLGRRLPAQMAHHAGWYLAVSAEPMRRAAAAGVGEDALVFVAGTPWCYSSFFLGNAAPPAAGGRVFVRDLPPLRAAALHAYPRAEVWLARVEVEIPDPAGAPGVARPTELTWLRLK